MLTDEEVIACSKAKHCPEFQHHLEVCGNP